MKRSLDRVLEQQWDPARSDMSILPPDHHEPGVLSPATCYLLPATLNTQKEPYQGYIPESDLHKSSLPVLIPSESLL